jgi:hypothetical protein
MQPVKPRETAGPPIQSIEPPGTAEPPPNPPESTPTAEAAAQQKPVSSEENPPRAGNSGDDARLSRERRLALLEDKFLMGEMTELTYRELKQRYSKNR